MVAGDRVFQIIDTDVQFKTKTIEKEKKEGILFDNVHLLQENEPIIKGIDLKIHSDKSLLLLVLLELGNSTIINQDQSFY